MSRRQKRVSDLLREVASDVLRRVKDPGLGDDLVSITEVVVSPDPHPNAIRKVATSSKRGTGE